MTGQPLGLDPDDLAACVSCGLCLPHCPTYRVTLDERRSPRGRIALMRAVEHGSLEIDDEWLDAMDTCIQCRGCETACPSSVSFGSLMADTRETVARRRRPSWRLRVGLRLLERPALLVVLSRLLGLAQRAGLFRRTGLFPARVPLHDPRPVGRTSGDVVLFTGCVMDAWMPEVHGAVEQVIEAAGSTVVRSGSAAGCCGALHEHAGLRDRAIGRARHVIDALPPDIPVLVDAAGCGAALKGYGELVGTEEAHRFAARVHDVHEWLASDPVRRDRLVGLAGPSGERPVVVVQDPCHLRHVQRVDEAVHEVLEPFASTRRLDDHGLCCGAGGAFAMVQPELASGARDRKLAALHRAGDHPVVSANPGCAMHLAAAGVDVRHPLQVVAEALPDDTRGDR